MNGEEAVSAPVRWTAKWPDVTRPAAGLPLVAGAEHVEIYHATPDIGTYCHGAVIGHHEGVFAVAWKCHARDEDATGQRILYSVSSDGRCWSDVGVLFDPLGPVADLGHLGVSLFTLPFEVVDGRFYAVAVPHEIIAWEDHARTARAERGDCKKLNNPVTRPLPPLARRMVEGRAAGPPFWMAQEAPPVGGLPTYRDLDEETTANAAAIRKRWGENPIYPLPDCEGTARLCEPVSYRRPDGNYVLLARDDLYSLRMFAAIRTSPDNPWPRAVKTNIPDSPSLTCVGTLPDGRIYLIGNQLPKHWLRDPLTIAVSEDGIAFSRAWAIRAGAPDVRHQGAHKGPGFQYPDAIAVADDLFVAYSVGKEDVAVTRLPIAALT